MTDSSDNDVEYEPVTSGVFTMNAVDEFVPPNQRLNTTALADALPPELAKIDPRRFFPDYQLDKAPRFTRILASVHKPNSLPSQIWWTSKTFNGNQQLNGNKKKNMNALQAIYDTDLWKLRLGSPPKPADCITPDEVLLSSKDFGKYDHKKVNEDEAPWRFGPAQIWYDRMKLPANPKNFDYGFKLNKKKKKVKVCENFLPVDLIHWEDDVIIDDEAEKHKLTDNVANARETLRECGWIPTSQTRTYDSFISALNQDDRPLEQDIRLDANHSIFPFDAFEFEKSNWEENIIWDAEDMPFIPKPRVVTLDYNDDPELFVASQGLAQMHKNEINENDVRTTGDENLNDMQTSMVKAKIVRKKPTPIAKQDKPFVPKETMVNTRCKACGELGHMKTNRHCPFYKQKKENMDFTQKIIGDVFSCPQESMEIPTESMLKVQDTCLTINKKALNEVKIARRRELRFYISRSALETFREQRKLECQKSSSESDLVHDLDMSSSEEEN
ncbi:zinc knuckle domain-containing protein [Ditylenchus destructor]|nr:zinc knuckle domain-containing protein [Ditylenchus destructor]